MISLPSVSDLHIELDAISAHVGGQFESGQGVFGRMGGRTTVGEN